MNVFRDATPSEGDRHFVIFEKWLNASNEKLQCSMNSENLKTELTYLEMIDMTICYGEPIPDIIGYVYDKINEILPTANKRIVELNYTFVIERTFDRITLYLEKLI